MGFQPGGFVGREALLAQRVAGADALAKRLVAFRAVDPAVTLWGGERLWRVRFEGGDQRGRTGDEHAGIPEMPAAGEIAFGRGCVGLLDETFDPEGGGGGGDRGAGQDVAIPGFRRGRPDAEGDDQGG